MFVYVLKSEVNGKHYVGLTANFDKRIHEHNSGLFARTRYNRPFIIVHVEILSNRSSARELEKFFKSGYGREVIKEIESSIP